jgi:hypothetical protein
MQSMQGMAKKEAWYNLEYDPEYAANSGSYWGPAALGGWGEKSKREAEEEAAEEQAVQYLNQVQYQQRMGADGEWGGEPEIMFAAELTRCCIILHSAGSSDRVFSPTGTYCPASFISPSTRLTTLPPPPPHPRKCAQKGRCISATCEVTVILQLPTTIVCVASQRKAKENRLRAPGPRNACQVHGSAFLNLG